MMEIPPQRRALLLLALAILMVSLSACQLAVGGQSASQGSSNSALSLNTSNTHAGSTTPAGAPFTIGAWPSNSMPGSNERIIIYIVCRVQDPTMRRPSTPAAGVTVQVRVLNPINWSYGATTNRDGMARVPISFHNARLGLPIIVDVAATWHDVTYQSQTSFTPAPGSRPSQPSGGGIPHHTNRPTPTPTSGPTPKPTVTPNAGPTPTPLPTPVPTSMPTPTPTPPRTPTASPASP